MQKAFTVFIRSVCHSSLRYPIFWFLLATIPTILAVGQIRHLQLDTNLIRLLPQKSRAAEWTKKLEKVVGDGGYFTILFEGEEQDRVTQAVTRTAEIVNKLDGVQTVEFQHPVEFFKKFRYLLIPSGYLNTILDQFIRWETEVNPLTVNLLDEEPQKESFSQRENRRDIERLMDQYGSMKRFHQSKDGNIMGMIIRPQRGVTRLGEIRDLYARLEETARRVANGSGIWYGISGSLRNKINEYDLILSDLRRSGIITAAAIILILILGFRSISILPVLLTPLAMGLTWSMGLIPAAVGDLNTITSFMLLVSFGLGIDFSIHLVKRFQKELKHQPLSDALLITFRSTGLSVLVSGLTTALALFVLSVSGFRGIAEFGRVGGIFLVVILFSMFMLMPATLILGQRLKLLKQPSQDKGWALMPRPSWTVIILIVILVSAAAGIAYSRFDYDFNNLKATIPESTAVKQRQYQVYPASMSPAAIFVAEDINALDAGLEELLRQKNSDGATKIGWIRSLRDFIPGETEFRQRLELLAEIKEQVEGRWIERLQDPDRKRWIDDIKEWAPYSTPPRLEDIPSSIQRSFKAKDDSGAYLIAVYPNVERKDGRNAMAFTQELYDLSLPESIRGPVGETPVFAEILWLVTSEGPWLTLLALGGIFLLIIASQRSLIQSIWILMPLVTGVILTFGVMVLTGIKLNFFNIVVIPSLLGMGVDAGVHYYRRWRELGGDIKSTQDELFSPLTVASVTTMCGYSGMIFARHPGLHSIGILACVGLACTWITSLLFLPGVLAFLQKKKRKPR